MLTLCALGVRDAYLISAGLVGLDPLIHAGTVGLLESLRMCGVHRPGLQLTASNEGASTMCSRVHLLANPSSPRLSPGGTNLFIADGLTYVVPVFIQPPRLTLSSPRPRLRPAVGGCPFIHPQLTSRGVLTLRLCNCSEGFGLKPSARG